MLLTLPIVALEMGGHLFGWHPLNLSQSNWVQLVLPPGGAVGGLAVLVRGAQSIATRNLNMFTLIALGTGVAWIYSVIATATPACFRRRFAITTARSRSISRRPP